jgi:hypothetical protein
LPGDSVRKLLATHAIEARFIAGPPTSRLAPIVSIHDGAGREIIQLGIDRTDFVYRYWGLADEVRFDHADLRVDRWFDGIRPGDTTYLAMRFTRGGYCLQLNQRQQCRTGFSVGDTWSLIIRMDWSNARTRWAGMAWLMLVFFPVGFVARNRRALAAVTLLSALSLFAGPLVTGFAATRWFQILASLVGIVAGYVCAGGLLPLTAVQGPAAHAAGRSTSAQVAAQA